MWFKEHKFTVAMIGVLILFGILVVMSLRNNDGSSGIKGNMQSVINIIEKPLNGATNGIKDGFNGIFQFKQTVRENKELTAKVKELEKEKADAALESEEYEELKELSKVFNYSTIKHSSLQAANIISVDHSNWMQIFTIDQGSNSGIKEGAIVLDGAGIVGKVMEVTADSSKIISLLDDQNKISFQVKRDNKLMGILKGDGKTDISGYLIDGKAGIKKGDILITSGIGNYPKGLTIGTVTKVEKNKGNQFINIVAKPSVKFNQLKKVAVLL